VRTEGRLTAEASSASSLFIVSIIADLLTFDCLYLMNRPGTTS
jgi:hypothetical protein